MIASAISASSLVNVIIWIIVAGLIFWLLTWLVDYCGVPEPFRKVAKVVIAVVAVLMLINAILTLAGSPLVTW
jgi:hypothetical protein